jgi:hypothetical protein
VTVSGPATKSITKPGATLSHLTLAAPTTFAAGASAAAPDPVSLGSATLSLSSSATVGHDVTFTGGTLDVSGTLTVAPGAGNTATATATVVQVHGTLEAANGTFTVAGTLAQTTGTTKVDAGATLSVGHPITVAGGSFEGLGTVAAGITATGGTIAPGIAGVGTLTVQGAVSLGAATTLAVDVSSGAHDKLSVTGAVVLSGRVIVHDLGSYVPAVGTSVTAVTATGGRTGTLACTGSTGSGTTGTGAGHWKATPGPTTLVVVWAAGPPSAC